jgi:hypothetical protein
MEGEQGWNDSGDYSFVLPDDTFPLFGDDNLDLDFDSLFVPSFLEDNNALDLVAWDGQEYTNTVQPEDSFSLWSTTEACDDLEPCPVRADIRPEHASISSASSDGSSSSEEREFTDVSTASGAEVDELKHQLGPIEKQRKLFKAFSMSSGDEVRLHTRKRFSPERKKMVALNRMIGVCLHCRLRKVPVSLIEVQFGNHSSR